MFLLNFLMIYSLLFMFCHISVRTRSWACLRRRCRLTLRSWRKRRMRNPVAWQTSLCRWTNASRPNRTLKVQITQTFPKTKKIFLPVLGPVWETEGDSVARGHKISSVANTFSFSVAQTSAESYGFQCHMYQKTNLWCKQTIIGLTWP